jgi:phosphate transport system substrate-binding protein
MTRSIPAAAAVLLIACGGHEDASQATTKAPVQAATPSGPSLTGAGATFPYPIYSKWFDDYAQKTGVKINYQAIGSGGGIRQLTEGTVDFGASDAPMSDEEMSRVSVPVLHFPTVIGAVAVTYNLPSVQQSLKFSPDVLADIFLGKITKWNDPAIKKLNPNASLPSAAIAVVHRSDGSGTTFNFSYYLGDVSSAWKSDVGVGKSLQWPVGIGAKGNEGVANNVANTKGSIGYVEYAYALQNKLTYTKMRNKSGHIVAPTAEAFAAAAANADWKSKPGYGVILANQPGAESWPMTAATWILVYKNPKDPAATAEALKFFDWSYAKGKKMAQELDYVAMPDKVANDVRMTWSKQIMDSSGKPVYMMTN